MSALFYNIITNVFSAVHLRPILSIIGGITIVASSVLIYLQNNIKRIISCVSIHNVGSVFLLSSFNNELSKVSIVFLFFTLIFFVIQMAYLLNVVKKTHSISISSITDISGLFNVYPMLCIISVMSFIAFAGFPPFMSFFYKLHMMRSAMESCDYFAVTSYVLSSIVLLLYVTKICNVILFSNSNVPKLLICNKHFLHILYAVTLFSALFAPIAYRIILMADF